MRTLACVVSIIPNVRSLAFNTLSCVHVEVWSLRSTDTLCHTAIKSKSGRATLTFLSSIVIMSVICAALALLSSDVKELRSWATDTSLSQGQDGLICWTATSPSDVAESKSIRTGQTSLSHGIPLAWRVASNAESSSVDIGSSRRT